MKYPFGKDIKDLVGEACIIQLQNGQVLVRKLLSSKKSDAYKLICINQDTKVKKSTQEELKIISAARIIRRYWF